MRPGADVACAPFLTINIDELYKRQIAVCEAIDLDFAVLVTIKTGLGSYFSVGGGGCVKELWSCLDKIKVVVRRGFKGSPPQSM